MLIVALSCLRSSETSWFTPLKISLGFKCRGWCYMRCGAASRWRRSYSRWKEADRSAEDKTEATCWSSNWWTARSFVSLLCSGRGSVGPALACSCRARLGAVCDSSADVLEGVANLSETETRFSPIFSLDAAWALHQLCLSIFSISMFSMSTFYLYFHYFYSGLYLILCKGGTNRTLVRTTERYEPVRTEDVRHRTDRDQRPGKECSQVVWNTVHGNIFTCCPVVTKTNAFKAEGSQEGPPEPNVPSVEGPRSSWWVKTGPISAAF